MLYHLFFREDGFRSLED